MRTEENTALVAQVRTDQVRMVYEAAPLSILTVLANSTVLAVLHWSVIQHTVVVTWLAAIWLISAFRLLLTIRFRVVQPTGHDIDTWAKGAQAGVVLSGISWGAAGYFLFAVDSLPHQAFLSIVIAGMAAGAVATLSAQRWSAIAFVLLTTLPLLFRFSQAPHAFASVMSLMVLLFMLMMVPVANRFHRNLSEMLTERHERQLAQQRDHIRNQVLELLANGAPLAASLEAIVRGIERECSHVLGSILLLDETGKRFLTGAAPSLPAFYTEAVHGLEIAHGLDSCATAALTGTRVIVEDIQSHPHWAAYKDLAARAELGACWSEPIFSASGKLLGSLAIYHRDAHSMIDQEFSVVGNAAHLAGIAIERHQAQEELRLAALVYQSSFEAMMVVDAENRIVAVNPAFTDITGYSAEEVVGRDPKLLSSRSQDEAFYKAMWAAIITTGRWQGEIWNQHKVGNEYAEWLTINTIYDETGKVNRRVALFSDITEKKKADALIWNQANYESLTGLPNRRLFADRLEQGLKTAHRNKHHLALLFLDLDRFKEVNDTLGHHMGDILLVEAARRIKCCVRESDTVARVGGDEFTVILAELNDVSNIGRVSHGIIESLSEPFQLGDEKAFISASIGITVYPDDATQAEELLKNADQAMFAAKQGGRNRFSYFTKSMQEATQQRMRIVHDMRQALSGDEFSVYFQPIVETATGSIHKAEALLRWKHPQKGLISPATFIPIAEETGAIHEIGNWVFKESARWVKRWRSRYNPHFQVSVNKSPVQFLAESLAQDDWVEYLRDLGLSGEGIAIEITEGVLLNAAANINEKLLLFRDAGIQVAIDDFGTGYSSLAYLKRFDVDYLKIDQSFISNLESDASDLALSEAIVVMAHKLGFKVIAEGVETEAQHRILKQIGCDYAQGYLFSQPLPAEDFEMLLQKEMSRLNLVRSIDFARSHGP